MQEASKVDEIVARMYFTAVYGMRPRRLVEQIFAERIPGVGHVKTEHREASKWNRSLN